MNNDKTLQIAAKGNIHGCVPSTKVTTPGLYIFMKEKINRMIIQNIQYSD